MIVVLAALAAAAISGLAILGVSAGFDRPPHVRSNFRGREVIGTGGIALLAGLAAAWAVAVLAQGRSDLAGSMALAGAGMAILGYVDDRYGDRRAGGLVGHARALLRGKVTTGTLKAAGGGGLGLLAAWIVGWRGVWMIVAGAVVALASNLANLFDLRPGRSVKVWLLVAAALAFALDATAPVAVLAGVAASALVFLVPELRERMMLGDTGAGLLGAVAGAAAIGVLDRTGLVVVGGVLLALTLLSEVVSFSRVIDAVPPLRWADGLGRRP